MKISVFHFFPGLFRDQFWRMVRYLSLGMAVFLSPLFMAAQNININGQVFDEAGSAIAGVSVVVKGVSGGTATDASGAYDISAPSNGTLVFSSVGYLTREIAVNNQTTIDVVLSPTVENMEQVVVIGYGTQRREAVTGSVASLTGDKLQQVPASNISDALQGRLAGVQMTPSSSQPGAAMQIRIRGVRSLTANNDPLIVLDGIPFPGSISDINPSTVKSIDILKDASATAIYGSRGANGVILVTTEKGNTGQKPKISLNSYQGSKQIFNEYPMMNGPEFVQLRKDADMYVNGADEADSLDTDWQSFLFRPGFVTNNEVSVSNGTESGSYRFGVGYYRDEALIPTQNFSRYSINGAIDQNIGKYFGFGFRTNNNFNVSKGNQIGIYNVLSMSPISGPYNADGSFRRTVSMSADQYWVLSKRVIDELGDAWVSQNNAFGSYNTLYGEVKIPWVDGLKYRANVGLNYRNTNSGSYTGEGVGSTTATTPSTASIGNSRTIDWTIENLLTYDRTFGKSKINALALYSTEEATSNNSSVSAKDIPSDAFQFYNLGLAAGEITIDPDNQGYQKWGLLSYMGRILYSYDNRYMLTASYRSDGSSRLAKGHKWHSYEGISAGWNIARESFMNNVNNLDELKLRIGYGQTANQAIAPYSSLGLLSPAFYNFGEDFTTGYSVTSLPNNNLGWEYSKTWNFGVDFSLFKGRLNGTVEYYRTNTQDLLLSVGLPTTAGVGSFTDNVGSTTNNGIEFTANGTILQTQSGWRWDAGFNIYGNRNKITALASGQLRDEGNAWFVGYPVNVIYDYKRIGLWQEGDPYLDVLEPGGNVGMIKVQYNGDLDQDGKPTRQIGPDDREILDVNPDFEGGFNTSVSYKGFDLSVVGTFRRGGILISTLYGSSGYLNLLSGRRNNVKVDYWTPEHTDTRFPKPGGIISNDNPKYGATLGYFDGSYLKFRTITLGYDFAHSLIRNTDISRLRVYFMVQNPFVLFSPYNKLSGLDPEPNSVGNQNQAVNTTYQSRLLVVGTNSPSTRNFIFGVNLSF